MDDKPHGGCAWAAVDTAVVSITVQGWELNICPAPYPSVVCVPFYQEFTFAFGIA